MQATKIKLSVIITELPKHKKTIDEHTQLNTVKIIHLYAMYARTS